MFVLSSYDSNKNKDTLCKLLGFELAYNNGMSAAGSKPGTDVISRMDRTFRTFKITAYVAYNAEYLFP